MQNINLFTIKPLKDWISGSAQRPAPQMLFGEFWIEGEIAVLFSEAGRGKSILGVQIAQSIASGVSLDPLSMTARAQKVLYFDFELSPAQFAMRYSAFAEDGIRLTDSFPFSKNFHRAALSADSDCPEEYKTYEDYLLASITDTVKATGARVVVIDNIAWLQGARNTARHTVPLMRELKRMSSALGLSILILAHNSGRDSSKALAVNGLRGARIMSEFADSVLIIGQSRLDSSVRYVKHIKSRSTELVCDESNVLVGEIRRWEKNFLGFRFHRYSRESDHISYENNPLLEERIELVKEMTDEGMTQRQIATQLGISLGSVNRYLQMSRENNDYLELNDDFFPDDDRDDDEDNSAGNPTDLVSGPTVMEGAKSTPPYEGGVPEGRGGSLNSPTDLVSSPTVRKGADEEPTESDDGSFSIQDPQSEIENGVDPVGGPTVREGISSPDTGDQDDYDPMARYGLTSEYDAPPISSPTVRKGLDSDADKQDDRGHRTAWGWDRCSE